MKMATQFYKANKCQWVGVKHSSLAPGFNVFMDNVETCCNYRVNLFNFKKKTYLNANSSTGSKSLFPSLSSFFGKDFVLISFYQDHSRIKLSVIECKELSFHFFFFLQLITNIVRHNPFFCYATRISEN